MTNKQQQTIEAYNASADRYNEKFTPMDSYDESYDTYCSLIEKENAKVLEIACGPGNVTRKILDRKPNLEILGIDLAPRMVELAKERCPEAEFILHDCRNVAALGQTYDSVMCGFCFPYLSKEEVSLVIQDVASILKENGTFYLSMMEDSYSRSGFETTSFSDGKEMYIHYHEADYILESLSSAGFEIIETSREDYPEEDGTITTDLILIARKSPTSRGDQ